MGLYASLDIISDWGFPAYTPYCHHKIDYSPALNAFEEIFYKQATKLCPVDTGYLVSTISASPADASISCDAIAEYAEYVEYGTWCCPAQAFFTPAIEEASSTAWSITAEIYQMSLEADAREFWANIMGDLAMREYVEETLNVDTASINNMVNQMSGGDIAPPAMPLTVTLNGITVSTITGEELASSQQRSNPSMWRENTTAYKVAQKRSFQKAETLLQIGAEIAWMKNNVRRGVNPYEGLDRYYQPEPQSFGSSIAENIGFWSGAYAMLSAWGSGSSWLGGLGIGMAVGAGVFLLLAPILEALIGEVAYGNPQFSFPEIIIM